MLDIGLFIGIAIHCDCWGTSCFMEVNMHGESKYREAEGRGNPSDDVDSQVMTNIVN